MQQVLKCKNQDCPIKNDCYRQTAPDAKQQDFGVYKYKEGKGCTWFWDNKQEGKNTLKDLLSHPEKAPLN